VSQGLRSHSAIHATWRRLPARRAGIKAPLCGSVTAVQLWGSLLQLTPHFHSLLPDGVFTAQDGSLVFHRLAPPEDADVDRLLERISKRVLARFDQDDPLEPDDDELAVAHAQAESLHIVDMTPRPAPEHDDRPLCAAADGLTLHADWLIAPHDRAGLRRAIRYGLRPPLSQKRLSLSPDGKVRLQLRKPLASGRTHLLFEPVAFLRRLAACIPRPRQNTVRFHGLFAPKCRPSKVPPSSKPSSLTSGCRPPCPPHRRRAVRPSRSSTSTRPSTTTCSISMSTPDPRATATSLPLLHPGCLNSTDSMQSRIRKRPPRASTLPPAPPLSIGRYLAPSSISPFVRLVGGPVGARTRIRRGPSARPLAQLRDGTIFVRF
jgi:hypothetical protein